MKRLFGGKKLVSLFLLLYEIHLKYSCMATLSNVTSQMRINNRDQTLVLTRASQDRIYILWFYGNYLQMAKLRKAFGQRN